MSMQTYANASLECEVSIELILECIQAGLGGIGRGRELLTGKWMGVKIR
jgi:hypothetical protein